MDEPYVARGLFSEQVHAEIKQFVNSSRKYLPTPEDPLFNRNSRNDVPFFTEIHGQLTEYASEIFKTAVKPSYSFLSMYHNKGECPLHIDRQQCRFTIDYLIQQESSEPWDICISAPMLDVEREHFSHPDLSYPKTPEAIQKVIDSNQWTRVGLLENDAVCYSGTHSWHYRPEKSKGSADLVFFHFVKHDFLGSLS